MLGRGSQRCARATSRGHVIRLFGCGAVVHASNAGSTIMRSPGIWPVFESIQVIRRLDACTTAPQPKESDHMAATRGSRAALASPT